MDGDALAGARVLVLEDEFLIAMDLEQLCRDHGARAVSITRSVAEAEGAAAFGDGFDVVIVDVMLDGQSAIPFAAKLRDAAKPFVFTSGFARGDGVFSAFPGVPVLGKPYAGADLIVAMASAIERHPAPQPA